MEFVFKKLPREQLEKILENAIKALADKRNFDVFTFTLYVDGDESDIEVIKHPRFGCTTEIKVNDEMDDVSDEAKDAAKKLTEAHDAEV